MRSIATIFERRVGQHVSTDAVSVDPEESCREVFARMAAAGASAAIISGTDGQPVGILTEADLVQRVLPRDLLDASAAEAMSAPVETTTTREFLYSAISRMRRLGLRHLPVLDESGRVVGMLDLHAAYGALTSSVNDLVDRLSWDSSLPGLTAVKAAQVELAEALFAEDLNAPEILSVLSEINRDIHARTAALVEDDLTASRGWGPAPVRYALLVMGSAGRGESLLAPDQDNGLILQDYPDSRHDRIDAWFREFSSRLVLALDQIGLPLCTGYVMATNPLWRKTGAQWRAQIDRWLRLQRGASARFAEIMLDFAQVAGPENLGDSLRRHMTERVAGNHDFLADMYDLQAEHRVPLGWFGRLQTERRNARYRGCLDLKHWCLVPLIEGVRLLAAREAIGVTSTLERVGALHDAGVLDADESDELRRGFRLLTRLLLRRQIDDAIAGHPVSNYVHPRDISRGDRRRLREALGAIGQFRDGLRGSFTGSVIG